MPNAKRSHFSMRIAADKILEFKVACLMRGGSMSGLLNQFIARTISEEKQRDPTQFLELLAKEKRAARMDAAAQRAAKNEELVDGEMVLDEQGHPYKTEDLLDRL